jgi:hypothetical protein
MIHFADIIIASGESQVLSLLLYKKLRNNDFKSVDGAITVDDSIDNSTFFEHFYDFIMKNTIYPGDSVAPLGVTAIYDIEDSAPFLTLSNIREDNGETNETTLSQFKIQLFEIKQDQWYERGITICRILKHNDGTVRIVARDICNLLDRVNFTVFKEMKCEAREQRFLFIGGLSYVSKTVIKFSPLLFKFKTVEELDSAKRTLDEAIMNGRSIVGTWATVALFQGSKNWFGW